MTEQVEYDKKVQEQINQYANNNLRLFPPAAHKHWAQNYVTPKLKAVFDVNNHVEFYVAPMVERPEVNHQMLSVASGDGNLEVALAKLLLKKGVEDFTIHMTELSPVRQKRAVNLVKEAGLADNFDFHIVDLNQDFVPGTYDQIMAHHSLHHIVELELLFKNIEAALPDDGTFASIDMIGRNGHMRWPEALEYVELCWNFIPEHWKYNFQFRQFHKQFLNHDCSGSGFEGIRAQDILPLLVERFGFSGFMAEGGFLDIMIERGYGQSIDMENPRDADLVEFLCRMNEMLLETGRITPTNMYARMHKKNSSLIPANPSVWKTMTPEFCVRDTSRP